MIGPTVTIDVDSPPGSWRAAIEPGRGCKGCGQTVCNHPDAVYQGVVPLPEARG